MNQFNNGVPFDPGFSKLGFIFSDRIEPVIIEVSKFKAPHQRKFKLSFYENMVRGLIDNCAAFYLGCILWGAFIHHKFKNNPKAIIGNHTLELSEEALESLDYAEEIESILKFIQSWDRDFKYFLKKPFNINNQVFDIFDAYKEFVKLNDNFINVRQTSDVKLPEIVSHFENFDSEKLDNLNILINDAIESNRIEKLLDIGFYR